MLKVNTCWVQVAISACRKLRVLGCFMLSAARIGAGVSANAHWRALVVGCVVGTTSLAGAAGAEAQPAGPPGSADVGNRDGNPQKDDRTSTSIQREEGGVFRAGTGRFVQDQKPVNAPPSASDGPKQDVVFNRAPVGIVVQTLLSEVAGVSVLIDPRVTGELTIRSYGQLSSEQLPQFLAVAVASIGLELVEQAPKVYLLRPAGSAGVQPAQVFQRDVPIGSGVTIYDLRYVSAEHMRKLLQPLVPQGVTLQVEPSRELLFLSGPPEQVRALIATIELFDVDWLAGISLGLAPLSYVDPETMALQLRTLFGGEQGAIGGLVEFVPLKARRALIVLAKRPERLDQARAWITQLDQPDKTGGFYKVVSVQHADAEKVYKTISQIFSGEKGAAEARIAVDAPSNALVIYADPQTSARIEQLIKELDVAAPQVVIEAKIVEVALNKDFEFGVQWSLDTRDGGLVVLSEAATGAILPRFPGFSYGLNSGAVEATLNAIASKTNIEIVSSPVVVTQDNEEAQLQVGDQVPVVVQSATNITNPDATVVNTVEYRDTGIVLKVRPRVGSRGAVTLEIMQEVSDVVATTSSGIDSPTIQQRRFNSIVTIQDGGTVALGGLIRGTRSRTKSGIPLLSALPVLGAAFGSTSTTIRRSELLIFLTPRIVRSQEQQDQVSEELIERMGRLKESGFVKKVANDR